MGMEQQGRGPLVHALGDQLCHRQHMATSWRPRPSVVGHLRCMFKPLVLLIHGELAKTPLLKIVELHVVYNFDSESNF